jgi:hypothetical protein
MTHHIKYPEHWTDVDALHNCLWKRFPMDRFEFIPSAGESAPEYSGTTLPPEPVFIAIRGVQPRVAFFDKVGEAVAEFLREGSRSGEGECLRQDSSEGALLVKIA